MNVELKSVIDTLTHDGNQLEHHVRVLRSVSP